MAELTSVVGMFISRKTNGFANFCVDLVYCFDIKDLPKDIKHKNGKATITITGNDLPNAKGVNVKYFGEWIKGKYGYQFKAVTYEVLKPKKEKGILSYLCSNKFKGLSKANAELIVNTFGTDTFKVFEEHPEDLIELVGEDVAKETLENYELNKHTTKLFTILGKYGISYEKIADLYEYYGEFVYEAIQKDPYQFQESKILSFTQCDTIAIGEGVALDSPLRVAGAILFKLKEQENLTGSTAFEKKTLLNETYKFLNSTERVFTPEKFKEVYQDVLNAHMTLIERKLNFGDYLQNKTTNFAEREISEKLKWLNKKKVSSFACNVGFKSAMNAFLKTSPVKLSENQQAAVKTSISNRVSVITGGPGTGKTTIIKGIISCYQRLFGDEITLMAPTGKAARRMSEATGLEAKTIHSRIGIYGDKAEITEHINSGLVVIDESSMIDLWTMQKLMKALNSQKLHVVFCGDVDQLPSVGCGCILDSMISSGYIATSKLTETFRQKGDSSIISNAIAINKGEVNDISFNDKDFIFIEANTEEEATKVILENFKVETERVGIENVALLSGLKRTTKANYTVCSDILNQKIQNIINPWDEQSIVYKTNDNSLEYRQNDRVLQWENTKTSSNGDIGVINEIYKDENEEIKFNITWDNGNVVDLSKKDMSSVGLGYSISIHKSQGSEYDTVIIPMLECQSRIPLFKRNLIYTGVTRAKKKVIIVGSKKAFNKCVLDNTADKRFSFLGYRLAQKG